jgi:hypothetical protein
MLRSAKYLKGFAIGAKDGDIGEAYDFIFDDKNWTVRYVVADTQRWLPGRKVRSGDPSICLAISSARESSVKSL